MKYPKGKIIAIGGAEDKGIHQEKGAFFQHNLNFVELGILRRIVEEANGMDACIEIVTTASTIPFEVGNSYLDAFGKIGCTNVNVIHIRTREDLKPDNYLERIKKADCVMFTGGNQMRLTTVFGGTEFLKILRERYQEDASFLLSGTSAGAMAMSNIMIYEGSEAMAHLKGEVKLTTGLSFMNNVIFDSHFEKRGRFVRLVQAVASNPTCIGVGLGEDTGMLIKEGNKMEAIGSGLVVIIDGHEILHCNIADIPHGNPMSIEGLKVHFCAKGNGYIISERKFVEKMGKTTTPVMTDTF